MLNWMPEVAVDGREDAQSEVEAVGVINDLVGGQDEVNLERLAKNRDQMLLKVKEVEGELAAQQERVKQMETRRRESLLILAEKNRQNSQKTRTTVKLAESILLNINESIGPLAEKSRAQDVLTRQITLLEQLRSLIANLDLLERKLREQSFAGMASTLLATQQLGSLFANYQETPLVGEQLRRLERLQSTMREKTVEFFRETMKRRGTVAAAQAIALGHVACAVDVLGESVRDQVVRWYCDRQLADYKDSFRTSRELANLEGISKRLAWLKRLLVLYEAEHATLFPKGWRVDFELSAEFCAITARDIAEILQVGSTKSTVDLPLLQATVQQTRSFEHILYQRFGRHQRLSLSRAFEPFLFYFIEAHDKDLTAFRFGLNKRLSLADFDGSNVLTSAPELFSLFREILTDISALSKGRCLLDLGLVFSKHLAAYAKYIGERIPALSKGETPLKPFELRTLVVIINTCEYCTITTSSMVEKFQALLPEALREEAEAGGWAQQEFLVQLSVAMGRITQSIGRSLETAWSMVESVQWSGISKIGDHSPYVARVSRVLHETFPMIRSVLVNVDHYSVVCERVAMASCKRFCELVAGLKPPIGEMAAQQLLLDLEALRSTLATRTTRLGPSRAHPEGASTNDLARRIEVETLHTESLLKCLTVPVQPVRQFVEGYLMIFYRTADDPNLLAAVLQMKGVRRADYPAYTEELHRLLPTRPAVISPIVNEHKLRFFKLDESVRRLFAAVKLAPS